eukprot:CAMPEP_0202859318 /NCGR_PEP_ID=MMETSP1391-20130828/1486_1 /ASSEMBLY_ACC=CAM_ASM_000867 /TAXON_ID=1034604 /ORGANISM="Chlamydomonas leiostraca, Strain SAG 11-49" /LENGTH=336 /DNA_ID=CAMNT_0049538343 /DNA_START=15 /DNA_END=1021 /DNA_ORIENTATION=-
MSCSTCIFHQARRLRIVDVSSAKVDLDSDVSVPSEPSEPQGSVFASALLVAGTTVGAGILAVPAISQPAGFIASSAGLVGCCALMIATGLLMAEVAINRITDLQGQGRGSEAASLSVMSMAQSTLGAGGARAVSALYLFQHYCLLVAYISRAGELVGGALGTSSGAGSVGFALGVGTACALLPVAVLDAANSAMVVGVVATFAGLVVLVAPMVQASALLAPPVWSELPHALPVMALAFVYQNVVPVVVKDLGADVRRVRAAIVLGSLLPLAMFLVWEAVVLGAMGGASAGVDPLASLAAQPGAAGSLVEGFSFLAIVTSYIGFCLGLSDFLGDALG